MNKLFVILTCLILFIYIRFYFFPTKHFQILQTSLDNINISMIFERQPIILHEYIRDADDITKTILKYLYVTKSYQSVKNLNETHNQSRYLIIHCSSERAVVSIKHPKNNTEVDVLLEKNQVIILPHLWQYKIQGEARLIHVFDTSTYIINKIYSYIFFQEIK